MDKKIEGAVWEAIDAFSSPVEYARFTAYIEKQVADGFAKELTMDENYGAGELYGGRWFQDLTTLETWRLIAPDFPFLGLWEPVKT